MVIKAVNIDGQGYLQNPELLERILHKLPRYMLTNYANYRSTISSSESDLERVSDFLIHEAQLNMEAGTISRRSSGSTSRAKIHVRKIVLLMLSSMLRSLKWKVQENTTAVFANEVFTSSLIVVIFLRKEWLNGRCLPRMRTCATRASKKCPRVIVVIYAGAQCVGFVVKRSLAFFQDKR